MKILLVRHGQTDWNKEKKIMGRCDVSLNEEGLRQAEETSNNLVNERIDLIICSPLKRAEETAKVINKNRNIPIIFDERIIERDFGEFDGMSAIDLDRIDLWDYYKNEKYQKAENIQDFFTRIYGFLNDIKEKYADKNILIVSHGGVSIPIACYFKEEIPKGSLIYAHLALKNCEVAIYYS